MSNYTYQSVYNKLRTWDNIVSMRENSKWTFKKMAKHYNVSERRIRTEYENAVKVAEWNKTSELSITHD